MLSSLTQQGAETTLKALELGAVDFIDKTRTESSMDITLLADELIIKVRTIAGVDIEKMTSHQLAGLPRARWSISELSVYRSVRPGRRRSMRWPSGTSTGGLPRFEPDPLASIGLSRRRRSSCAHAAGIHAHPCRSTERTEQHQGERSHRGRPRGAGGVLVAPAGRQFQLLKRNGQYVVRLDSQPSEGRSTGRRWTS